MNSSWKHDALKIVALPVLLGALYLGLRMPGLGDAADIWSRYEVELDSDQQMYLLMALALRGELDALSPEERDRVFARLGEKQLRGFFFHFPQFAAKSSLGR